MKLLVYYNTLYNSFSITFESASTLKKEGDIYKINSILVNIIEIKPKPSFLKFSKRKLRNIKHKIGNCFIDIGNYLLGNHKSDKVYIKEKYRFPWWR